MNVTLWQDIQNFCKELHIEAVGVAPYPAPSSSLEFISPNDICPFVAGTGKDRLYGSNPDTPYHSAIVALFPYATTPEPENANLARYTRGDDYHIVIHTYMQKIANYIQNLYPESLCEIAVDTSPLADRYMAYLAGLGFFGKNHCFIHPTLGSYTAIGILLTTLPLPLGAPLTQSCAQCNRCIEACPGKALSEDTLKYTHCKSYLTQKKGELTDEEKTIIAKTNFIFGCDRCQEVCPHNAKMIDTPFPEFRNQQSYISPEELESLTNREFKEKYGHKAFSWRGKSILLRNHNIIHKK